MRLKKFLIICLAPGVFFSCSKTSDAPKQPEIIISTIKPFLVRSGDTITVTGKNFISAQGTTTVSLNGKQGKITESSNEVLKFVTPAMAGSGNVSVKVGEAVKEGAIVLYEYKATVTTIAGNGSVGNSDGTGTQASFNRPWGIAANDDGDLFVADGYNRLIRKISASSNYVFTYHIPSLMPGSQFFGSPHAIAIDKATQNLYVTDFNKHVMKMNPVSGDMEVIFVDDMPLNGIAVNPASTHLFITNTHTGLVLRTDMAGKNRVVFSFGFITPQNIIFNNKGELFVRAYQGPIYQIKEDGTQSRKGPQFEFDGWEIATDTSGNFFLADYGNNCIKIMDRTGRVTTIAGSGQAADIDGVGLNASFDGPHGITVDKNGNIFVTTYNEVTRGGNRVRKIVLE